MTALTAATADLPVTDMTSEQVSELLELAANVRDNAYAIARLIVKAREARHEFAYEGVTDALAQIGA